MNRFTQFLQSWVTCVGPPVPVPLCHYTSKETAKLILESGHLWFTNLWDLPNQHEIVYSRELIQVAVREAAQDNEFMQSRVKPLLEDSRWREFTNGQNASLLASASPPGSPVRGKGSVGTERDGFYGLP